MNFPPYYSAAGHNNDNGSSSSSSAPNPTTTGPIAIPSLVPSASGNTSKTSLENIMSMHLRNSGNSAADNNTGSTPEGETSTTSSNIPSTTTTNLGGKILPSTSSSGLIQGMGTPPPPAQRPPPPPPPPHNFHPPPPPPPQPQQFTFTYNPPPAPAPQQNIMRRQNTYGFNNNYFTPEQDNLILTLYRQHNKSWSEIAQIAKLESDQIARMRYYQLVEQQASNEPINWDRDDTECLKELLETGERAKWKFISAELTKERNKRITSIACQKKFKEMFGVAEASSILGSSLGYVVSPNGWSCLDQTKPISSTSMQSAYSDEL